VFLGALVRVAPAVGLGAGGLASGREAFRSTKPRWSSEGGAARCLEGPSGNLGLNRNLSGYAKGRGAARGTDGTGPPGQALFEGFLRSHENVRLRNGCRRTNRGHQHSRVPPRWSRGGWRGGVSWRIGSGFGAVAVVMRLAEGANL
jgi:hypothetical protein